MAKSNQKHEADDGQVALDFEGDPQEVIVSEENSPESEALPEVVTEETSEQEEYDSTVQKRINKLTKKMREAERREQEAINYAKNVQNENSQYKNRLQELDQGYVHEYGGRISAEQQTAEDELKRAVESGDVNATVEAQKKMTQLAVAQDRYEQAKAQQERQQAALVENNVPVEPVANTAPPPPDPKAEAWATENEWFGRDKIMTNVAYAIHEDLVNQGVDPRTDYYYTEIDKRMRDNLPHKFQQDSSSEEPAAQQPVQTVASANRNRGTGRNVVKLSSSEAAIAKRLGLSNEQYASEKLKLQRR